ncbi:MAG: hypothetical protein R6U27_02240 [Desulfobacterales bacterium]
MAKITYNTLIILLLGLSIFYYFEARAAKKLLTEKTAYLEKALEETNKNCENRVAELKTDCSKKLSGRTSPSQTEGLSALIDIIKDRRQQSREKVLNDVITSLELDQSTVNDLTEAIEFFENKKRTLMIQTRTKEGNIFNSEHNEKLNTYREEALALLQETFSEDQFKTFVEQGFDEKLDLRKR